MQDNMYTYDYFMRELAEFWRMMGYRKYWVLDLEGSQVSRALKGLVYVYSRLSREDIEKVGSLWNATLINYDMVSGLSGVIV